MTEVSDISGALQALVGSPLSIARWAADMLVLHFGTVRPHPRGTGTVGSHALHVQGPWRLLGSAGLITGQSDLSAGPTTNAAGRHKTLADERLADLLGGWDDTIRSHLSMRPGLVVAAAICSPLGDLDIAFADATRFQLFVDGAEENWRFFATETGAPHFVAEGSRCYRDDIA